MGGTRDITIVGGGLVGALLATLLAQRGFAVDVFERRSDPRKAGYAGGRSINLALAERGLHALRHADCAARVLQQAVMMRGRMVHPLAGDATLQRYGRDDSEVIWSIARADLHLILLDAAAAAGARLHFGHVLDTVDFAAKQARFRVGDNDAGSLRVPFTCIVGADGAGSALRRAMRTATALGEQVLPLGHGYKELEIPPAADGSFQLDPHALHIWPRSDYMCIALPNMARSFTVTLFMPVSAGHAAHADTPSFAGITDGAAAAALFAREFPDLLARMPALIRDFDAHPVGELATLQLERWHIGGTAVLLGDAAHAMVPFHGQGMNCAFEDAVALAAALDRETDLASAFAAFAAERRSNAQAIQRMALENYLEMRDRVDDADYLLQRELERVLAARHPQRFVPRYSLVTFHRVPYAEAEARGRVQRALLEQATRDCMRIEHVDMAALDARVLASLSPLAEDGGNG